MNPRFGCASVFVLLVTSGQSAVAESHGQFYPSVSITTDYRYNGVSYSDRRPAPQASLHWTSPQGWYGGLWTSAVDFDDPGNTSIETDVYAGRAFNAGSVRVAGEVLYTSFPDKMFSGPTYDFMQLKVRGSRSFRSLTVGALAAWTPEASYRSGVAWRVAFEASYPLSDAFKASANVGRRWIHTGVDRTFWDLGVTASLNKLALDVRYVDTNLEAPRCSFSRNCSAAVVATVTVRFW